MSTKSQSQPSESTPEKSGETFITAIQVADATREIVQRLVDWPQHAQRRVLESARVTLGLMPAGGSGGSGGGGSGGSGGNSSGGRQQGGNGGKR